jgi:hypothetical protein
VIDVFYTGSKTYTGSNLTLIQGLGLQGGPGVAGGQEILVRAAIAAFLNAADDRLGYPLVRHDVYFNGQVVARGFVTVVNDLLVNGTRAQMIDYAAFLDARNNLGCPL